MGDVQDFDALAADWVARNDRGLSDLEQRDFERWLDADVAHRVAWLRLDEAWRRGGAVRQCSDLHARPHVRGLRRPRFLPSLRRLSSPGWRIAAMLVMCLAGASGATLYAINGRGETMSTGIGGRAAVPLADGSRMELNTDTALRVAVRAEHREVWMEKGEAYFDVAKDPEHPFVIHAGKRRVTVLGTRFVVRRDGDRLEVTVAEGRVRVEQLGSRATRPRLVTVGDRLVAEGASVRVAHLGEQSVEDQMGWRRGRLTFEDASLGEVAAELNRYNETQIVIVDPAAGEVRIGGAFDPLDVAAFTTLIGEAYDLKVVRKDQEIYISGPDAGLS